MVEKGRLIQMLRDKIAFSLRRIRSLKKWCDEVEAPHRDREALIQKYRDDIAQYRQDIRELKE